MDLWFLSLRPRRVPSWPDWRAEVWCQQLELVSKYESSAHFHVFLFMSDSSAQHQSARVLRSRHSAPLGGGQPSEVLPLLRPPMMKSQQPPPYRTVAPHAEERRKSLECPHKPEEQKLRLLPACQHISITKQVHSTTISMTTERLPLNRKTTKTANKSPTQSSRKPYLSFFFFL